MNDYLGLTHMQRLISGSKVDESPTWFLPVYWASSIGCLPDCDKAKDPQACVGPLSYQGCWWIDVKKNHMKLYLYRLNRKKADRLRERKKKEGTRVRWSNQRTKKCSFFSNYYVKFAYKLPHLSADKWRPLLFNFLRLVFS